MIITVTPTTKIAIVSTLILLRVLVGYQPHSGQDDHHGKLNAYGGDYEAQRHWMELTLHLPMGDWYWYDLEYWGLDYPPLTAYVSWLCGYFSDKLIGPESVALYTSRGYEDPTHKAYMRATVLVLDILVYISIVWLSTKVPNRNHTNKTIWSVIFALSQPAIILIDHGHFQYNSVSLGLALWGFYYMTKEKFFPNCLVGSVFFCLALNFKQMILYYAPAVFAYLLGRCFDSGRRNILPRFVALGITVILTFALHWWPFLYYGPSHENNNNIVSTTTTTVLDRILHVTHRMFPFNRGLFEDKVSNLWCVMSIKPISIRQRLPENLQPLIALSLTCCLILPACFKLFRIGYSSSSRRWQKDFKYLLWGSANTALAFFLASFQVHEKSILMALTPISLLLWDDAIFCSWFGIISTWTLWPLLCIDRLQVAYTCIMLIYLIVIWFLFDDDDTIQSATTNTTTTSLPLLQSSLSNCSKILKTVLIPISVVGMLSLHGLQMVITPPATLPDLFPLLWSIAGCGMFSISWSVTTWHLYKGEKKRSSCTKKKIN